MPWPSSDIRVVLDNLTVRQGELSHCANSTPRRTPTNVIVKVSAPGLTPATTRCRRFANHSIATSKLTRRVLKGLSYVIGIHRESSNAGTISNATVMASAGVPVANRTSVASSMISDSSMVLMAV